MGIVLEAGDVNGRLRTEFAEGTTDAVRWFGPDELRHLQRVELIDFVLSLI